jgi:hypothetical protein
MTPTAIQRATEIVPGTYPAVVQTLMPAERDRHGNRLMFRRDELDAHMCQYREAS